MENPSAFSRFVTNVMDLLLMRPGLIAHLARRGIPTFLWVLNDDEDFYRAFVQVGCAGKHSVLLFLDAPSHLFIRVCPSVTYFFRVFDLASGERLGKGMAKRGVVRGRGMSRGEKGER